MRNLMPDYHDTVLYSTNAVWFFRKMTRPTQNWSWGMEKAHFAVHRRWLWMLCFSFVCGLSVVVTGIRDHFFFLLNLPDNKSTECRNTDFKQFLLIVIYQRSILNRDLFWFTSFPSLSPANEVIYPYPSTPWSISDRFFVYNAISHIFPTKPPSLSFF